MENIFFKGLEKSLNEGCYIKVFSCSMRYPVVRVEKKDKETNEEQLISYAENGNVLAALNSASKKIIDEISKVDCGTILFCERTLIDNVVERGYDLHFYKLSNGQVLSTICRHTYGNYIPIKSIISDDIQSGFEMLNATLQPFDFERTEDFDDFAYSQTDLVDEYQKTLNKKTK